MLLLDVGNSRCKWGYTENGVWVHRGAVDNAEIAALRHDFARLPRPARILASNVAGVALEQQLRSLCAPWAHEVEFVTASAGQCGVRNRYEQPARLGSDRWAALIAAWQRVQGACLVVNCGTATTVDALSDRGEFLGGLIVPGIALMRGSLSDGTALLPDTAGSEQEFPRNTVDAIHSGAIRATQGAIRLQYELLNARGAARCVLSGGAADQIQARLGIRAERVDNLVLEGLRIIGEASV